MITAWKAKKPGKTGKFPLVFSASEALTPDRSIQIPCGQCIGCRLERSRQWAMRCLHEMKTNASSGSAFLTLTYDEKNLPPNGTLVPQHLQSFMKRLRHWRPKGLRFFACGEYGGITMRPHFHVLLLNTCFPDAKRRLMFASSFRPGDPRKETYASAELSQLWTCGQSVIGDVTFESCCYVTAYCTGRVTGERELAHYGGRKPEFAVMSRRPGLGSDFFDRFHAELYAHDSAVVRGREAPLTRFYDNRMERLDSERLEDVKVIRRRRAVRNKPDNTSRRRWTKERLATLTLEHFKKGSI